MATIFLKGQPPTMFRVVQRLRQSGRWEAFTNNHSYDDAELAARGLISNGSASEAHILELGKGEPRICAYVSSQPKPGWPHGAAVVKKV